MNRLNVGSLSTLQSRDLHVSQYTRHVRFFIRPKVKHFLLLRVTHDNKTCIYEPAAAPEAVDGMQFRSSLEEHGHLALRHAIKG